MIEERKISIDEIVKIANQYNSVIEIGCGEATTLSRTTCQIKVGVEGCLDLINANKKRYETNKIDIIHDNILNLSKLFKPKSFDCVLIIDVIEHFEKEDALKVLSMCENIAKEHVLCFIPVGNHPQDYDDRGFDNELNHHRSTWYGEEMESLGYDVYLDDDYHKDPKKDSGAMLAFKKCKGTSNE